MPDGTQARPPSGLRSLSVRRLGTAPHRLMFFAGATNVMLAMIWWAAWLISQRWPHAFVLAFPPVLPGWLHAFVMEYQMLPSFIFGFLLTTFPKWTKQPELAQPRFVPVGLALIGGQLATLAGAFGSHTAITVGVGLTLVGWSAALASLVPMLWREEATTWHARSCAAALALGYLGILAFGAYLLGASAEWVPVSIKLGTFGMLLLVFFTVAHRMFPFFAAGSVAGYQPWRPMWLLAAVWVAALLHLILALAKELAWLWIPDGALLVLTCVALWRWWPRGAKPGLLVVLFLGLAWLPIAMALYTADSLHYAERGAYLLGRAPAHALFIGFFGSSLVAMVTRVTQGHSGRPLVMPAVAWFTFVAVQLVAIARILSELVADPYAWFAGAAVGWLIAFAPWVARLGTIYLAPRVDQKPG
ncbi:MAG TPA: NnrS family protein [Kofleriaceae bacterium]